MASIYQNQYNTQQHVNNHYKYSSHNNQYGENVSSDGWILYYSPEGFPYYYNEITGESQWAENEQEMSEVENVEYYEDQWNDKHGHDVSSSEDEDQDDETETGTGTEASTTATEEDDNFEKEFQAYLQSPAGQQELEEERLALENYSSKHTDPEPGKKSKHHRDDERNVNTEMDDMVINAFGTSAFSEQDAKYNPYQQQPFQEQFLQQKRQQQYEYEQYEYENHRKRLEEVGWENSEYDHIDFAKTYGLPTPPRGSKKSSSVSFEDSNRNRYYDDHGGYSRKHDKKRYKNKSSKKYGRREYNIDDDLEGGDFRDPASLSDTKDDDESSDSDSDISVSSEDSDVKIIRQPIVPDWMSWHNLTQYVDHTIRDPIINTASKLFSRSIPNSPKKMKVADFDEEEGSGSGSGSESFSDDNEGSCDDNIRLSENVLDIQPLGLTDSKRKSRKKRELDGGAGYGVPTTTTPSLYTSISNYLSLSTITTLFTIQQKEWLQVTYAAASQSVWNFVTNTAEIMVDGQPVRRGMHEKDMSQPLPP